MRDEAITTAPTLSKAEAAVSYILKRMRVDANLRHHLLGTEAFSRLCQAEAARAGKSEEEVEQLFSSLADPLP